MKITDLNNYTVVADTGVQQATPATSKTAQKGDFSTGLGKSVLRTVKGAGQIGENIAGAILPGYKEMPKVYSEEATKGGLLDTENLKAGKGEGLGSFVGDVAQFAIPGTQVSKATKGANLLTKIGTRAATSGGVAALQEGGIGQGSAIAAGTEAVLPIAGKIIKPATKFLGSLLKGTASGLSGAPSEAIEQIYKNPKMALQTAKEVRKSGSASVLRKNAEQIIQGVGKIKQEARSSYGKGLEQLADVDIEPTTFRNSIQKVLDKTGSVLEGGTRRLKNVEFDEPKNIAKANELINKISNAELNGKSLRKLIDDIENSSYKTATSDERMAFNVFTRQLASGLKESISSSTSKLDDINKAFSTDMQLAESVESIFGKVKYKNLGEILKASQKLEGLFTQKGLAPEIVDDFLERIGVSSGSFKSGEAMRQVSEKAFSPNSVGTSPFEVFRAFTSSVVSPKMVGQIAAQLGLAESVVKEMSDKLSPATRAVIIKTLMGEK